MKKLLLILLLLPNFAWAGEIMKAGTILPKDSYVFTIDEAQALRIRLEELEQTVENQQEEIEQYKSLSEIQEQKVDILKQTLDSKDLLIDEYEKLHKLDSDRINKLERQKTFSSYEKIGLFALGATVAIGSVLVADSVDDYIQGTPTALIKFEF